MVRRQYTEEDSPYVPKGTKASEFNQGLKSTPIYNPLVWQENAQRNIFIGMGVGADEMIRVAKTADSLDTTIVYYMGDKDQIEQVEKTFGADKVTVVKDEKAMLKEVEKYADSAMMGDAVYVCCPEMYIWKMHGIFTGVGIERDTVHKFHAGSPKRRVYCCHCQTFAEDVELDIYECSGCKQMIYIYDHFSRMNGAYLGFRVDAESPGEYPDPRKVHTENPEIESEG